jgi:tetratricopeptide (TPR) repeat protein
MKKLLLIIAAGLIGSVTQAQELPQPSPLAKIEQKIGLTDVSIEYSRPAKKGREIFGTLVPYDKVWRLGANACTKMTTSTNISIQGKELKAGNYAVFAIPQADIWTIVFNTDLEQWGAGNYDATKNVLEVKAKVKEVATVESFTISLENVTHQSAILRFAWDQAQVDLSINVDTEKIAEANIQAAIKKGEDLEKVYYKAASYYYKSLGDDKKALSYITKGINAKRTHQLQFLRAQILFDQGHKKEAIEYAEKAHKLALEADAKSWADYIQGTIDGWKE